MENESRSWPPTPTPPGVEPSPTAWIGEYTRPGVLVPPPTVNPFTFTSSASSGGKLFVQATATGQPPTGSTGPVKVVDPLTGGDVKMLEPSPDYRYGGASFSPDGAYLAIGLGRTDAFGTVTNEVRIYDTATWDQARTPIPMSQPGGVAGAVWGPGTGPGNEVIIESPDSSAPTVTTVHVKSVTGTGDRDITVPARCSGVLGWSKLNRVALTCEPTSSHGFGSTIATIEAVNTGTDYHVVAQPHSCDAGTCAYIGNDHELGPDVDGPVVAVVLELEQPRGLPGEQLVGQALERLAQHHQAAGLRVARPQVQVGQPALAAGRAPTRPRAPPGRACAAA